MRNCPVCIKEVDKLGRCINTSCIYYSHKIFDEILTNGNLKCDGFEFCGSMKASKTRQMTQYDNEESNYNTLCEHCQERADAEWSERWAEYNSGRF